MERWLFLNDRATAPERASGLLRRILVELPNLFRSSRERTRYSAVRDDQSARSPGRGVVSKDAFCFEKVVNRCEAGDNVLVCGGVALTNEHDAGLARLRSFLPIDYLGHQSVAGSAAWIHEDQK
jgi:hypothetical protein